MAASQSAVFSRVTLVGCVSCCWPAAVNQSTNETSSLPAHWFPASVPLHSISHNRSLTQTLSLSLYLSLCFCLCVSLTLALALALSESVSLWVSLSFSLSQSLFYSLQTAHPIYSSTVHSLITHNSSHPPHGELSIGSKLGAHTHTHARMHTHTRTNTHPFFYIPFNIHSITCRWQWQQDKVVEAHSPAAPSAILLGSLIGIYDFPCVCFYMCLCVSVCLCTGFGVGESGWEDGLRL